MPLTTRVVHSVSPGAPILLGVASRLYVRSRGTMRGRRALQQGHHPSRRGPAHASHAGGTGVLSKGSRVSNVWLPTLPTWHTSLSHSARTWSYSLSATKNMMEVTLSKQWIHFRLSDRWPPTSTILSNRNTGLKAGFVALEEGVLIPP